MEELIKRLERVISTGAPDKDGMHPISAEAVLEVVNELSELSTNLAEVGTDCISREQAINALKEHRALYCDNTPDAFSKLSHAEKSRVDELDTAIATLVNLPPAEPKRGKWIEDKGQQTLMQNFIERGEVWRVCSVCGAGHMIGHKYECDKAYHETHHNFCPNCGADMRGVNNESN